MSDNKYGPIPDAYPEKPSAKDAPPAYTQQPTVHYMSGQPGNAPPSPPDHLILSIFSILCCFWPLGLIALIKSIETRNHYQSGRYAEAERSSVEAKKFNKYAIITGIVINIVVWVIVIVCNVIPWIAIAAASAAHSSDNTE